VRTSVAAVSTCFFIVVYRPASTQAADSFFDELSDLLACTMTYAAPLLILGYISVHFGDVANPQTVEL